MALLLAHLRYPCLNNRSDCKLWLKQNKYREIKIDMLILIITLAGRFMHSEGFGIFKRAGVEC